jgi:hypothetical protein
MTDISDLHLCKEVTRRFICRNETLWNQCVRKLNVTHISLQDWICVFNAKGLQRSCTRNIMKPATCIAVILSAVARILACVKV